MTIQDLPDTELATLIGQMTYRPLSPEQGELLLALFAESRRRFGW